MIEKIKLKNYQVVQAENWKEKTDMYFSEGFQGFGRENVKPYKIDLAESWSINPYSDNNWMFQLHAWRMFDLLLMAIVNNYKIERCMSEISRLINSWLGSLETNITKFHWNDMATGIRASKIALIYGDLYSKYEVLQFMLPKADQLIDSHFDHLLDESEFSRGNHGLFQMLGLKTLSFAFNSYSKSATGKEKAIENMKYLINSQFINGVHTENSPYYHFFALNTIKKIISSPFFLEDELGEAIEIIAKAERATPWLVDVYNRPLPIGDSDNTKPIGLYAALEDWQHLKEQDYIGAVVGPYATVRTKESILPEKSSHLVLYSSYASKVHKHRDCSSFIWQENGCDILVDSGKYGYQKDKYRDYFVSSRAHNVLDIIRPGFKVLDDPYGFGAQTVEAFGDLWKLSSEKTVCLSSGDRNYKFECHRVIFYKPSCALFLIDAVASDLMAMEAVKIVRYFNFSDEISLCSGLDGNLLLSGSAVGRFSFLSCSSAKEKINVYHGESDINSQINGLLSKKYLSITPAFSLSIESNEMRDKFFLALTSINLCPDLDMVDICQVKDFAVLSSFEELNNLGEVIVLGSRRIVFKSLARG